MKIEGTYTFQLPIQDVYDALKNEELLRAAIPGKVHFDMTSPTHYEASMDLDVPKFGGHYEGSIDVTNTQEPSFYDLSAQGQGPGRYVTATGRVQLRSLGPNETEVHYSGKTDALEGFNRFLKMAASPVAVRFANRGLSHLERHIRERKQNRKRPSPPGPLSQ